MSATEGARVLHTEDDGHALLEALKALYDTVGPQPDWERMDAYLLQHHVHPWLFKKLTKAMAAVDVAEVVDGAGGTGPGQVAMLSADLVETLVITAYGQGWLLGMLAMDELQEGQ